LAGAAFAAAGLGDAAVLAEAFALAGDGFTFAGAACVAGFAAADFLDGVFSFAMTRPFRVRPLFAVAAILPNSRPEIKYFLCGAQILNCAIG
jgi:hypothetical protein